MNDTGIKASYSLPSLSKVTNPENTSQYELVKDYNSKTVNDLLIHITIPVTLYNNLLTFRKTDKKFELRGDRLKLITNKNYNVDLSSLSDKKLIIDFVKETCFDVEAPGNKCTRAKKIYKIA